MGVAGGQQAGPPGGSRQRAAQCGEWARTREAGSLALPVALRPLHSGSPFSQARRCEWGVEPELAFRGPRGLPTGAVPQASPSPE